MTQALASDVQTAARGSIPYCPSPVNNNLVHNLAIALLSLAPIERYGNLFANMTDVPNERILADDDVDHLEADAPNSTSNTASIDAPSANNNATESTSLSPSNAADLIKEATDRTLTFLATASNETLVGCLVGLGAATYILLGRVGLVLGGVVGGVYLHATWEKSSHDEQDDASKSLAEGRRKEAGVEVVRRLLRWRDNSPSTAIGDAADSSKVEDYSQLPPDTAAALTALTDAIIRDYVKWWYSPLVPTDPSFPAACRQTLSNFFLCVATKMYKKRPAESFLDFVMHTSSIVVVLLNELAAVFTMCPNMPAEDAVYMYLRTNPESNLANLLDKEQQDRKLRLAADDILQSYLDKDARKCPPVKAFLQQILAHLVLDMTISKCSQAAFLNEWIIYLLEDTEPGILNAIDDAVEEAQVKQGITIQDPKPAETRPSLTQRKRTISRAEEAMEEAMQEAQRLTQLMIDEDARRARESLDQARSSDELSSTGTNNIRTPTSSQGNVESNEQTQVSTASSQPIAVDPPPREAVLTPPAQITSIDQLSLSESPTAARRKAEVLTLYRATISIFDDSDPNDRRALRAQPEEEYLVQVEPRSAQHPGWMFPRSYEDFKTLHEIIRRIAVISGLNFTEDHASLPNWRGSSQSQLREELERYLVDALSYQPIADSEGMKRFMDRDTAALKSSNVSNRNSGFWPNAQAFENVGKGFDNIGKGFIGAINNANKNVAGGGKSVLSGVTGAFGKIAVSPALKKTSTMPSSTTSTPAKRVDADRTSLSSRRSSFVFTEDGFISGSHGEEETLMDSMDIRRSGSSSTSARPLGVNPEDNRNTSRATTPPPPLPKRPEAIELPPPPTAVPDDYIPPKRSQSINDDVAAHMSFDGESFMNIPSQPATPALEKQSLDLAPDPLARTRRQLVENTSGSPRQASPSGVKPRSTEQRSSQDSQMPARKAKAPLSEREAQVTVELLFTVINELYTLSSAWTFRRTLLNAAKTFLLRPGNPQLESIRAMVQDSVLEANTSDAGMASHILKIRENALPTEEELKQWPPEKTDEEKEAMRVKARRLLVEKGMPQALTSVMGAAASGEALGKVFDCLQAEEVARGLVFGLLLQALRTLTH